MPARSSQVSRRSPLRIRTRHAPPAVRSNPHPFAHRTHRRLRRRQGLRWHPRRRRLRRHRRLRQRRHLEQRQRLRRRLGRRLRPHRCRPPHRPRLPPLGSRDRQARRPRHGPRLRRQPQRRCLRAGLRAGPRPHVPPRLPPPLHVRRAGPLLWPRIPQRRPGEAGRAAARRRRGQRPVLQRQSPGDCRNHQGLCRRCERRPRRHEAGRERHGPARRVRPHRPRLVARALDRGGLGRHRQGDRLLAVLPARHRARRLRRRDPARRPQVPRAAHLHAHVCLQHPGAFAHARKRPLGGRRSGRFGFARVPRRPAAHARREGPARLRAERRRADHRRVDRPAPRGQRGRLQQLGDRRRTHRLRWRHPLQRHPHVARAALPPLPHPRRRSQPEHHRRARLHCARRTARPHRQHERGGLGPDQRLRRRWRPLPRGLRPDQDHLPLRGRAAAHHLHGGGHLCASRGRRAGRRRAADRDRAEHPGPRPAPQRPAPGRAQPHPEQPQHLPLHPLGRF